LKLERVEAVTARKAQGNGQLVRWLVWGTGGLALILLLAKLIFSLNIMWNIFNYAFQVDESEGMIVAETLLMDRGVDIYAPLTNERFIAAPYTSLYYLLNWPALHFTGASFKPGRLISFLAFLGIALLLYKLVRVYSLQFTVYSSQSSSDPAQSSSDPAQSSSNPTQPSVLIPQFSSNPTPSSVLRPPSSSNRQSSIVNRQWFSSFIFHPSSFAALFWLSLGLAAFWGGAVKPDMLALFFGLFGIYAVYRYSISATLADSILRPGNKIWQHFRQEGWLYGGAVLFALAAHTKQTAFAGVLACLVYLLFSRPTAAVRLGAVWAVLAFGPMLIMNWLSRGGWWYHIVTVHELPWSLENYSKFFGAFVQSYQLYVLLAIIFLGWWAIEVLRNTFARRNPFAALRSNQATLFALYLSTSWGAGLSAGTYGGNHNHLLEFAAAICLCSGVVLARLAQGWQTSAKILKWVYPVVLALICLQTLGLFAGEGRVKPQSFPVLGSIAPTQAGLELLRDHFFNEQWLGLEYRVPPARLVEGMGQVAAFMTNDVGPYLYTDNVSLAIASQKPVMTTDPFTQTHATYFGRWDESRLIDMIQKKQFHLIVLRARIEDRLQTTGEARDIYLSPGLAHAILENYKLTQSNAAFIYEPK
jgi:4-amino-4-deoxy-L-arabinose transferase-like glycosyltransferase